MSKTKRRWQAVLEQREEGLRIKRIVARREREEVRAEDRTIEKEYGLAVR